MLRSDHRELVRKVNVGGMQAITETDIEDPKFATKSRLINGIYKSCFCMVTGQY